MPRLTAAERHALPARDFAGPDRSYPDEDRAHARDALARVAANGSPHEKAAVRHAVAMKYPDMVRKGG